MRGDVIYQPGPLDSEALAFFAYACRLGIVVKTEDMSPDDAAAERRLIYGIRPDTRGN